jgi:hypothetical protein
MAPGLPRSAVPLAIRNCSHPGLFCTAPGFTVQAARLKRPHRSAVKRSCTAPRSIVRSVTLRFQSLGSKRTPRSAVGGSIPQSTRLRFQSLVSRRTIRLAVGRSIPQSARPRFQSLGSKRTIRLAVGRSIPQSARLRFQSLGSKRTITGGRQIHSPISEARIRDSPMSAVLSERSAFGAPARHRATRSGGRKPPVEKQESHICNSVRRRNQRRMACASRGERIESADEYACVLGAFPDAAMFRSNLHA